MPPQCKEESRISEIKDSVRLLHSYKQGAHRLFSRFNESRSSKGNPDKTRFFQQSQLIPSGDRSTYSLRPGFDISRKRRCSRLKYDVGKL